MSELPSFAFKVLTAPEMATFVASGKFQGAAIDISDGFIHLSTAEQVDETIAKHFAGQRELMIAKVDLTGLGSAVRWEESRGGALFPHIYADLQLIDVPAFGPLEFDSTGKAVLPG